MFVDQNGQPVSGDIFTQPPADNDPAQPAPDFRETTGAAFRQENILGSYFSSPTTGVEPGVVEEGYNPWADIEGTPYEPYWDRFTDVHNSRYATALKSRIDQEIEDRRTLGAAGWKGLVAGMGAGLLDLPTLIPGGVVVQGGKGTITVSKLALQTAAAGALDGTISEIGLQQSQETRGYTESLINIGASTILSGLLGAGAGKFLQAGEFKRLEGQLGNDLTDRTHADAGAMEEAYDAMIEGQRAGVGAEAAQAFSKEDLEIRGKAANALGSVAPFNPMIGLTRSESAAARSVAANLPEMGFALKMTGRGASQPQAVETYVKQWTLGAVGSALDETNRIFTAYRKAGGKLGRAEFHARAGDAMRNLDEDTLGDDFVSKAAQVWRRRVFDPLKKEAIDGGLLPEDIDVSTADSYFTRIWNKNKIIAQQDKFASTLNRYFKRIVDDLVAKGESEALDGFDFKSSSDVDAYVREATEAVIAKLTGRDTSESPMHIVPLTRGPLKERTLNIPDAEVLEFLENDIELVGRQYARIMGSDVELQRKFGRADMRDQIQAVARDYEELRNKALANKDLSETDRAKLLQKLDADERKDVDRIEGLRDRLRGTYLLDANTSTPARVFQGAMTFNYLRTMGGVTLSSLSDVGRHAMMHGFGAVMRDGIAPLVSNLKGVRLSRADAKLGGTIAETLHNTRMATMAELTDPYAYGHPVERWLNNAATGFSKVTGMPYWNEFQKTFAAQLSQARILRASKQAVNKGFDSLPKREQRFLSQIGLGRGDLETVGDFYIKEGIEEGGLPIARLDRWGDTGRGYEARRLYMAAVNKSVDTTIVTKGIGDTPLALDHPVGRAILQFKSFALASHQRVLMRAAQDVADAPVSVLAGMTNMIAVGSFLYWLKSKESGRDISDNPGKFLAEGIDRSGLAAVFMEFNNIAERIGAPGLYSVSQAAFPERDQGAPASRYAIRSTIGSLLGPTFGLASDVTQLMGVAGTNASAAVGLREDGQPITEGDINAARRLLPGSTLPIIRSLLEYLALPALKENLVQ
jgi:hypothetical protein